MHCIIYSSYTTNLGVLQDITAKGRKVTEYVMSCSTPVTGSPANTAVLHIRTIFVLMSYTIVMHMQSVVE